MAHRRIGVVGGVGPAATILYYRLLIDGARARGGGIPEIVIDSLDLDEIERYLGRRDLDSLEQRLVRSVAGLGQAGCDSVAIACNAMHLAYGRVAARVAAPMVNLIDAVLDETVRRGYRTVGLLASTFVVTSGIYRDPLEAKGIRCLIPGEAGQDWIMKTILGDLQEPVVPAGTVARLLQNVADLRDRGAEAVILGCTDLPVAITEANSPIPVLDTAQIHVDAVLDHAPVAAGTPRP